MTSEKKCAAVFSKALLKTALVMKSDPSSLQGGSKTLGRRWKLPASSQYSFLGKQKGLISEEIKPFIMRLVEISGIEPLTFPAVNAGKPAEGGFD